MNRYCFYFFVVISFNSFSTAFGQEKFRKPIIVIDPGHGGSDYGAVGINGLKEKDVALKIATEVLRLNKELFADPLEIYCTRYTDTLISLGHRTKLASALNAAVFVSVHCNQANRKTAQGIEVFISQANRQSEELAGLFLEGLHQTLGNKNRGLKYSHFQVLREITDCPSVLLELGFLSNGLEAAHNAKESSVSAYALFILETLRKFTGHD